jgi:hypothetical protein
MTKIGRGTKVKGAIEGKMGKHRKHRVKIKAAVTFFLT